MRPIFIQVAGILFVTALLSSCDLIRRKPDASDNARKPVARVNNVYLYEDELEGITTTGVTKEDSVSRVSAYVNSWIRKQLIMQEAEKKIDINEADVQRKVLEYRYSLIGYEYQNYYIGQNLVDTITEEEISQY